MHPGFEPQKKPFFRLSGEEFWWYFNHYIIYVIALQRNLLTFSQIFFNYVNLRALFFLSGELHTLEGYAYYLTQVATKGSWDCQPKQKGQVWVQNLVKWLDE